MKRIAVVAFACLLGVASSHAELQETAPPTLLPNGTVVFHIREGDNAFAGHFGEVLRYANNWTAEPSMQGLMEVVRFHPDMRGTGKSGRRVFAPFQPKQEEYVPENFEPMELAQLFVIPKDAPGGIRSLRKLRAAKEKELAGSGKGYEIRSPDEHDLEWPENTFFVSISTPYKLFQAYSQSDKNFFILTAGKDPSFAIEAPIGKISESMREYLRQFQRQVSEDYLVYRYPRLTIPWALVLVIAGSMGLLSKQIGWRGRLRLIGRATFVLSASLPLLGLAALLFSWRHGLDKWINAGSISCCIAGFLPFLLVAISSRLGGRRLWRVFLWTAGINLLPVYFMGGLAYPYYRGSEIIEGADFFGTCILLIILGLICGIGLGLTHNGSETSPAPEGTS